MEGLQKDSTGAGSPRKSCVQMVRLPEVMPHEPGITRQVPTLSGVCVSPMPMSMYASMLSRVSSVSNSMGHTPKEAAKFRWVPRNKVYSSLCSCICSVQATSVRVHWSAGCHPDCKRRLFAHTDSVCLVNIIQYSYLITCKPGLLARC